MYCATFTITSGWRWFDSNSPDQTAGEFEGDGQYNEITSGDTGIDMVGNGETVSTGLGGSYAYDQSVSVSSSASCGGCASDPMSVSGTLPSGLNWTGSGFSGTITQAGPFSGTVSATELGSDGSPGTTGSADWNFTVSQATQSVSFQSTPPSGATYTGSNNQTYGVAASSTSGLPVALTIDGSSLRAVQSRVRLSTMVVGPGRALSTLTRQVTVITPLLVSPSSPLRSTRPLSRYRSPRPPRVVQLTLAPITRPMAWPLRPPRDFPWP